MKTKKMIAMMASVMMFGSVAAACGDSNKENKTPHTTYSEDQINNMSDDELEKVLENAAKEIEMSEKAEQEAPAEEIEGIDFWKDVKVTFTGAEGFFMATAEYVGDNQIIMDNVKFGVGTTLSEKYCKNPNYYCSISDYVNGYDEFNIYAFYDEVTLKEKGVVLKKNTNTLKGGDVCSYTISGLGHKVELTDDTDTSVFVDALDVITDAVKKKANDENNSLFDWAKGIEIYPDKFYIRKDDIVGSGWISYLDKDGNFLAWVEAQYIGYVQADGKWCREVWIGQDKISSPWTKDSYKAYAEIYNGSIPGIGEDELVEVEIS